MAGTGGRERFPVPSSPSVPEAQSSDARHQIEFTRPGVARHDRIDAHAVAGEHHMALVEQLAYWIVPPYVEAHLVDADRLGVDVLLVTQAVEIGRHERLDDKCAVVGEMGG